MPPENIEGKFLPNEAVQVLHLPLGSPLCSIRKFNPKRGAPQFLFFQSCYVTELEKNTKFRKNPMREIKVFHCFVCDAMLKMAKPKMGVKSGDSDHAHLLDFRVCH